MAKKSKKKSNKKDQEKEKAQVDDQDESDVEVCGGINPYTLTAKLGPARIDGSGPSERRRAA